MSVFSTAKALRAMGVSNGAAALLADVVKQVDANGEAVNIALRLHEYETAQVKLSAELDAARAAQRATQEARPEPEAAPEPPRTCAGWRQFRQKYPELAAAILEADSPFRR